MDKEELEAKVKAAHDAIDRFAEGALDGSWFVRGLDREMHVAISRLRECVICADPVGHITTDTRLSAEAWNAL